MAEGKGQSSAGTIKSFKCDLVDLMTAVYSQQKEHRPKTLVVPADFLL